MNEWDDEDGYVDDELAEKAQEETERQNKEAFAAMADAKAARAIREKMLCGHCKASTFLVWDAELINPIADSSDIVKREERRSLTRFKLDGDEEDFPPGKLWKTFLVRCSFFRMNVPDPTRIIDCEAFRQRRADKETADR